GAGGGTGGGGAGRGGRRGTGRARGGQCGGVVLVVPGAAGWGVVDFSAAWCPPCRMIEPVVDELASSLAGQPAVSRLDLDRHPETGTRFGVLSLPTLILFARGRPVDRVVGFSTLTTCAAG